MTLIGKIYKIQINEENIYVGSTRQKLCHRQNNHNNSLKKYPERKLYKKCIENNIDSIKCIWIADCEYNSIEELRMIEEDYRKALNGNLNMKKCYVSEEEKKEYSKKYHKENKDKISEKKKEYYQENKIEMIEYSREYRENNKEKIKERKKIYRDENKSKIKEKYNEKIKCNKCNSFITRGRIRRHQRTKKCILLSECIFSDDD